MENCPDKYLHKKFKKQLSCEPTNSSRTQDGKENSTNTSREINFNRTNRDLLQDRVSAKNDESDDSVPTLIKKSSISSLVVSVSVNEGASEQVTVDRAFAPKSPPPPSDNDSISRASRPNREPALSKTNFDTNSNFSHILPPSVVDQSSSSFIDQTKRPVYISPREEQQSENKEVPPTEKSSGGKYICSYCNLACSKPSVLQKHIRAHTNERPYPCLSCGFSFKTRSNLYKHCRSRTHANRVMGNKTQEVNNETEECHNRPDLEQNHLENNTALEIGKENTDIIEEEDRNNENKMLQDVKSKPYKPRFHTKVFYENTNEESSKRNVQIKHSSNSDYLSLHINEVINKNNAIVNSSESFLLRKRSTENIPDSDNIYHHKATSSYFPQNMNLTAEERNSDEPLNLSNKNRKRCVSEVAEPAAHKSLIKELLLKNLYADTNMQCPYCKMIFQTVTELELHKLRSCKGFTKSDVEYNRSNSVNVASLLTHNKNAFDSLSQFSSPFALKSPGPFLGKTRLVESDKGKSFSFDDNLPASAHFSSFLSPNGSLKTTQRYSLSPLTIQHEKDKKPPVKLFGGEVKITQKSGETKSFKIDNQEADSFDVNTNFIDYGGKLRENTVVKSSLQSGGTVLQGKPNYRKEDSTRSSPEVIRVYETTALSPSIDVSNLEKKKFNFERGHHDLPANDQSKINNNNREPATRPPVTDVTGSSNFKIKTTTPTGHSYKYTNIMDFSQKAAKMLAPNLKQPNLAVPGIPIPNRVAFVPNTSSPTVDTKLQQTFFDQPNIPAENDRVFHSAIRQNSSDNDQRTFIQKQHQHLSPLPSEVMLSPQVLGSNLCNPVNLFVDGKVIRYVPGIPGPFAGEPMVPSRGGVISQASSRIVPKSVMRSPKSKQEPSLSNPNKMLLSEKSPISPVVLNSPVKSQDFLLMEKRPIIESNDRYARSPKMDKLEIKVSENKMTTEQKSPSRVSEGRSPIPPSKSLEVIRASNSTALPSSSESQRKFTRPNTLALKPSISTMKQHHGLTPTMFNQILISPETPRVAKKYIQHFLNGNYFSYLGLKSSTKPTYCTLNKTQPFYVPHFKKLSMYSEWRQQESKTDELYVSAYDSRQKQQKFTTAGKTATNLVVHSSYKSERVVKKEVDDQGKSNSSVTGGYESNEEYTYIRGRGRGRYICDQCGIRCKKPSMLKKHIRTHTNDRPFTCSHCNFSFKTKGNLTKHMKSKSHTKNYAASSSSSGSAHQSGTQSSETDTDDSGMDSSDESTRQQEHEAAYGLLSLSQNPQSLPSGSSMENFSQGLTKMGETTVPALGLDRSTSFMNTEQVTHVNNTNYAKNKILDHQTITTFSTLRVNATIPVTTVQESSKEVENLTQFLGKTNTQRPLTYPYLSVTPGESPTKSNKIIEKSASEKQPHNFSVISRNLGPELNKVRELPSPQTVEFKKVAITISYDPKYLEDAKTPSESSFTSKQVIESVIPLIKVSDNMQPNEGDFRKRKISVFEPEFKPKLQRSDSDVMDLSCNSEKNLKNPPLSHCENGTIDQRTSVASYSPQVINLSKSQNLPSPSVADKCKLSFKTSPKESSTEQFNSERGSDTESSSRFSTKVPESYPTVMHYSTESSESFNSVDYDNSAMQTLADVATKQVKLEKNTIAKNVASAFLKLATKSEFQINEIKNFSSSNKDVNELIAKSEENKSCSICLKNFNKPSQLRLHMNIHYLERPFRCDSCSVSFRTKGHLQKHERSASHHNKKNYSMIQVW
ncbi:zinc finger protein 40 isoform X2 [Agrilus planipennis]|uniref:Zinc finger protein 40 isoform X2 n=1 Tax=Agrilus planipennis TaxID=224129 RepID=A0A7F5R6S7_AGRPL|nr:zinc finger protein 40 isoform X2 [Agrilus planipennis]